MEATIDGDGFDDEISLSISGLGTGVTGTFAGTLFSTDTSTTLTVSASRTAALTTRNFTVTGTADNGLTRTVSGSVTVTVRQPTSLSITPSEVGIGECYTISAGNAANMTLDLQYTKDGAATQTITGWPALDANGSASACPTLESQLGDYRFTGYRNTQASTWLTSNVSLRVVKREFTVSVSPASGTLYRSGTQTYTVTVGSINRFTSPVTLTVSGLPTGVTGRFATNPVTPGGTSVLTLTASATAALGTDEFTVTGTGGGLTRTGTADVVVPHFRVAMSPETGYVNRGSSRTFTVTVTPENGFSRPVTLSVSGLGSGLSGSFSRSTVTTSNWTSVLTVSAGCSAAATRDEFRVTGNGGGYTAYDEDYVTPRTFEVLVTPARANLIQGGRVEYDIEVDKQPGFTGNVRLSVSGLPDGVTGSFSSNPTHSTSTLTLTASSTAELGEREFTVTGTAHGCTASGTARVNVTEPPRFEVRMTPETANVDRGSSQTYTVTVAPETGFTSNVTLSVSGLGTGLTGSFSRNPVGPGNWTSTLTVSAGCGAARGSDNFTVTGTGGGASDTDSDTVVVQGFDIAVTPETANLQQGSSVDYRVGVTRDDGFTSAVTLSVSGLPAGVTGAFSTNPAQTASTLTLTATAAALPGRDEFTVTGTAQGCTDTDRDEVVIVPGPSFSVSTTPETANLVRGGTVQYTVTVAPETNFTSAVTLSVSGLPTGVTGAFSTNPVNAGSSTAWTSTLTLTAATNAATGSDDFTVTGTSGTQSASDTDTVVVTSAPICTVTLTPTSVGVAPGSSGTLGVSVALSSVFGAAISFNLSAAGLPAGVTGAFSPATVTSGDSGSTLTLTAAPDAAPTTGSFTVTATAATGSCVAMGTVLVTSAGFALSPGPLTVNVVAGSSQTATVTVSAVGAFSSPVTLAASGLPTGVTGAFSPPSVTPTTASPNPTSTLTLTAGSSATAGRSAFSVTATGGGLTRTLPAAVVITSPQPTGSFTLSVSPGSLNVTKGDRGSYTVQVNRTGGFSGPVTLSVSGLSNRITPSFSVNPVSESPNLSRLTLVLAENAPSGNDEFTVTGTAGDLTDSATATVRVQNQSALNFRLNVSPARRSISPGQSQTYQVSVRRNPGRTERVTLSVGDLGGGFTASFSANPILIGGSSTLIVTAPDNAAPGEETFYIQGSARMTAEFAGQLITQTVRRAKTAVAEVPEPPAPDFTLAVTPPTSREIARSQSLAFTLTVTRMNSLTSPIHLSVEGLESDSDLTPSFSDAELTVSETETETTSTLTLTAGSNAVARTDEFKIVATSTVGGQTITHSADESATVTGTDFSLAVDPNSGTVSLGFSLNYTVTVTRTQGFLADVVLSVSGLGTGVVGVFPVDPPLNSTSTLTLPFNESTAQLEITVNPSASLEAQEFTIRGVGGGLTRTIQASFEVVPPTPRPEPTVSPTVGSSEVVVVTLIGQNYKRTVAGGVNTECGKGVHSAPFGNWGVASNYGDVEDTDQFRGWKYEDGLPTKLQWNSCTSRKSEFLPGNCEFYNDNGCLTQKSKPFEAIVTHGRLSYRYSETECPAAPAVIGEGPTEGCRRLNGISVGQFSNHMTVYELDRPDRDDLVKTIYFPGTWKTFSGCGYENCPEVVTDWVGKGSQSNDGEPDAIIGAEFRMKARAVLHTFCDWESSE